MCIHDTVVCNEVQHLRLIARVRYYWRAKKSYSCRGGGWFGQSIKYWGAPWIVGWMPATCVWQC